MLRTAARAVLSPDARAKLRRIAFRYQWLGYVGNNVECPCCGAKWRTFLPHGRPERLNARCGKCDSVERHRMIRLFLNEHEQDLRRPGFSLLHFAGERILRSYIEPRVARYVNTDLMVGDVHLFSDITKLPFSDGAFDAVICVHILEHVPDDGKAMQEVLRILKPGGWAILQVPLDPKRASTYEDWSITDPAERFRHFGQEDHCRVYGNDYYTRLAETGFRVERLRFDDRRERYGLLNEELCLVSKP